MTEDSFYPGRVDDSGDQLPIDRSGTEIRPARLNPRYLFIDPSSDFGRSFYKDLLMEQQEQM